MTILVFSYSHADESLRNELEKHLSPLMRMGRISTWHDRRISAGEEFEGQIDLHFSKADIILLLISADFISSDYCYQIEMSNALQRHDKGEAIVIPVILRSCAWHSLPFGKLLAATTDGKPIVQFTTYDDGFVQVVDAVTSALDKLHANPVKEPLASPQQRTKAVDASFGVAWGGSNTRSSNLAIHKSFTDLDRDRACREGFNYLTRFFENSLNELKNRNPSLDIDFHLRDADAFTSTVYRNGSQVSHCGIWRSSRGTGSGDICYSSSGISQNSYNESMSITDNGQLLGFQALMGHSNNQLLTNEGMAEHFWDLFISPLKQNY